MSAYVIGHITVREPETWQRYREQVPATLAPWNATLLFRGHGAETLAGSHRHEQTVVIEFPDSDAARGWYRSDAYQALVPLRLQAADVDLVLYPDDGASR